MSAVLGEELVRAMSLLTKLPGMGPRSARRAVFEMVKKRETVLAPLIENLQDIYAKACLCHRCHHLDMHDPCLICSDPMRETDTLCIVEESLDVWTMERIGLYRGLYHVLGGTLSIVDNMGPDQLSFEKLMRRIEKGTFREVTLALSATVEGQTTTHYVLSLLKEKVPHIFTLAQGIPLGGNLDYLDDGTLALAFKMRRHYQPE